MPSDDRYSLQSAFPPMGPGSLKKLQEARVLIVGVGGLGSWSSEFLARAGVGFLRLVDPDFVAEHNLPRSNFLPSQVNIAKVFAAHSSLIDITTTIQKQQAIRDRFRPDNAMALADGCHLIMDGTDRIEPRLLINQLSLESGIPWVRGAVAGADGVAMLHLPHRGACLQCLFKPAVEGLQDRHPKGVVSPLLAAVAALQTSLAIRYLVGTEEDRQKIAGKQFRLNLWDMFAWSDDVERNPDCPICGHQ